jgi:hypothetical protein
MNRYALLVFLGLLAFAVGRFRPPQSTSFASWEHPPQLLRLLLGAAGDRLLLDIALYELASAILCLLGIAGLAAVVPPWAAGIPVATGATLVVAGSLWIAGLAVSTIRVVRRR